VASQEWLGVLALVGLVCVGALAGVLAWWLRRALLRQGQRIDALERDLQALCDGARGLGDALADADRRLRGVVVRQDQIELQSGGGPYGHAIAMVRQGAAAQDLVRTCGLTPTEAQLVHLLHRAGVARSGAGERLQDRGGAAGG
jgi:hypothetical protein